MPFAPPWRQYQSGDLLYGLARNRGQLAGHFGIKKGDVYTIDQYTIMGSLWMAILADSNLKFDPEFIEALERSDKTKVIVDSDLSDQNFWKADLNHAVNVARRKCKAGLEYITHHTLHHIHFCLDGLNLIQAASKNYDGKAGGIADTPGQWTGAWDTKARSITGAELRWVYRNRFNPKVGERIQFWKLVGSKWVACPPPWDDPERSKEERDAFASYKPRAVAISVLGAVDAALKAYDNKIHWFFAHSDASKNAEPKLKDALKSGDANRVLGTACYYLNVTAAKGPTPPAPNGLGARLQQQSHLYRYLYTELSGAGLIN